MEDLTCLEMLFRLHLLGDEKWMFVAARDVIDGTWQRDPCCCLIICTWWMALIKAREDWDSRHLPLFPASPFFFFPTRRYSRYSEKRWALTSALIKDIHKSSWGHKRGLWEWIISKRWTTGEEHGWCRQKICFDCIRWFGMSGDFSFGPERFATQTSQGFTKILQQHYNKLSFENCTHL